MFRCVGNLRLTRLGSQCQRKCFFVILSICIIILFAVFQSSTNHTIAQNEAKMQYNRQFINSNQSDRPKDCLPLHFSPVALPHIALVSVPGSGNTWVRHLIQQATGLYSGSMYRDQKMDPLIFPNDPRNNSVIVTKRHNKWSESSPKIVKAILLVRNPFDAILAEFNREVTKDKTMTASKDHFQTKEWTKIVEYSGSKWLYNVMVWLVYPFGPVHVVRYEDLKSNLKDEMRKICIFLGHPASEETLDCVVRNSEGAYRRNRTETDRTLFPLRIRQKLESDMLLFDRFLEEYR
ncbi:unnamed protein product [Owenia fusiformis]|uniref:Sulfotransferase domain-containing protein n=1 Tax=Owenia fusiformis TaxID=6347 RepID=A0A8S4Q1S2_OWEFU|nr:unnamed protein product [Owenia fusiformis]